MSSILAAAEAAEAAVAQRGAEPRGRLKITATPEFGTTRVDGWVAEYLFAWPKVTVEAIYAIRIVDIVHEGIDVAIRIGALPDSELSSRKLGEITYGLYASPGYLERAGDLHGVEDLKKHDLVMKGASWTLVQGGVTEKISRTPRCAVDNMIAIRNLALAGLGVARLPRYMAEPHVTEGALTHVLPGWSGIPMPVHAVFTSTRYMDPKVRVFVDLCRERFSDRR